MKREIDPNFEYEGEVARVGREAAAPAGARTILIVPGFAEGFGQALQRAAPGCVWMGGNLWSVPSSRREAARHVIAEFFHATPPPPNVLPELSGEDEADVPATPAAA